MSDTLLQALALLAATTGMASFALANEIHWRQLLALRPQTPTARLICRAAGYGLLALSFALCCLADPLTMAILVWPMLLGVAAALVATTITLKTRAGRSG